MPEPIRVLWLARGLGPGGMERLLVAHAQAADHGSFSYSALYLRPDKQHLVPELEELGVRVTSFPTHRSWDLRWALRMRTMLRREPVDVVHAHSPLLAAVSRLVVRSLPKRTRPASVSTEHNMWNSYGVPTRLLNSITFGLDDAHIAVSEPVRQSIPARKRDCVTAIVHGIDLGTVAAQRGQRQQVRDELGIGTSEVVIGTVANYRVQKAYPDLLAAARLVIDTVPTVRFVALGQGPLESEITALHTRLGLGDRFILTGYRADATRVMSAFDVFTLASIHEGLPVALMEARALGLPVVVTRVGGLPDHVSDGADGLLVPPGSPGDLAAALIRIAEDGTLRSALAAASAGRAAAYDAKAATGAIEALYRKLADARPGPSYR